MSQFDGIGFIIGLEFGATSGDFLVEGFAANAQAARLGIAAAVVLEDGQPGEALDGLLVVGSAFAWSFGGQVRTDTRNFGGRALAYGMSFGGRVLAYARSYGGRAQAVVGG
jgi:hypothetical protein